MTGIDYPEDAADAVLLTERVDKHLRDEARSPVTAAPPALALEPEPVGPVEAAETNTPLDVVEPERPDSRGSSGNGPPACRRA